MSAEIAITATALHIARCRAEIMTWPEHDTHKGAVSSGAYVALNALAVAVDAMMSARKDIEDGSSCLESIADQIHDMASDITGTAQKRMERPAYEGEMV